METLFVELCKNGDLIRLKQLLQVCKERGQDIDISAYNELAFFKACSNGHLDVAQWLLQIKPDINISAHNEWAFHGACYNGHLDVAQWLLQMKPDINISAMNNEAFISACQQGQLDVVAQFKLLIMIGGFILGVSYCLFK